MAWEHFPHGADIGVRGIGTTREEAFAAAALALTAVLTDPARVDAKDAVEIRCEAPDDELLLVDWLNALVYEMATRNALFGRFEVKLDDHRLQATAWGELLDRERHRPAVEVKGATYTALSVAQGPDGQWIAQCVVDV
ncbi:MAG TPA: archease [Casimicrobiaceae bacterium]